jgi:hypothetical protein
MNTIARPCVFTWLPLPHLPTVPDHFVEHVINSATPAEDPTQESLVTSGLVDLAYKNRTVLKDGIEHKSRVQERFFLGNKWEDWVRQNIIPTFSETSGRINVGEPGSTLHGAHTDGPIYRLFYLIMPGGDCVETVYYLDPAMPILHATSTPRVTGHYNMDELIEIDRTQFPVGQWILHNGYVLHGVENITGTRININVTIRPELFDFCIKYPG